MKSKNTATINYLRQKDVFADLVNYVVGDKIITDTEKLVERDPVEVINVPLQEIKSSIGGKSKEVLSIEKIRDILKRCEIKTDGNYTYILVGIESQSEIHYALPVRNMLYDALNYHRQVEILAKENRSKKKLKGSGEYLSGIKQSDRILPVITITLYWGPDEWNGPRCLKDMFKIENEKVADLVQDYSINLIAPKEITDTKQFESSLREVIEYIQNSEDEKGLRELLTVNRRYEHMEYSALRVLQELGYWKNEKEDKEEGSETDMCKAWDANMARSEEKGRIQGRLEGQTSVVEAMLKGKEILSKIILYSGFTESAIRELADRIGVAVVEG